jgi:hypothetical protein
MTADRRREGWRSVRAVPRIASINRSFTGSMLRELPTSKAVLARVICADLESSIRTTRRMSAAESMCELSLSLSLSLFLFLARVQIGIKNNSEAQDSLFE